MTKKNRTALYIGLVIVLAVSTVIFRTRKSPSGEHISLIRPSIGTIRKSISCTAIVQPQNRLEIKPPINGRIEEILVKEGEKIKAGQVLAWMSSTERAALLDAAMARGEDAVKYWREVYKPTPLIAPIDGEVIVSTNQPGQTVTSSDVVVVLSDYLIVQAQVDETDIGKVELGQQAYVVLDAYPDISVKGKINHIYYESNTVNNVTVYKVDIVPESIPPVFRSGMSATVDIAETEKENSLLVPLEAVRKEKDGDYLLVHQGAGAKPVKRKVELGISDEKNAEVLSGIGKDEEIEVISRKYTPVKSAESGANPFMPSFRKRN